MVLSDRSIREALASGRLVIDPLGENAVQPASLDVRLDRHFRVFRNHREAFIDVRQDVPELTEAESIADDEPFVLHPGEFVLGSTVERVELADDLVARVEGKSSLGRLGLLVHATAGFVDPGWKGHLTLELSNVSTLPIRLYYGMKIGQLSFQNLTTPAERPYGHPDLKSRYQGQEKPTASRIYRDFSQPSSSGPSPSSPAGSG
ncbi:MAG: dCTP deaminase [Dehalococcoidia bacterium]|nr:dCTP deaminase [Dehalococcoidia bacterium]